MPDSETTWRQHYESVAAQLGKLPAELANEGEIPEVLQYIVDWFQELSMSRGSNGFGPAALTFTEIEAWARLLDRDPDPFEVQCLKELDLCYLVAVAKATREEQQRKK